MNIISKKFRKKVAAVLLIVSVVIVFILIALSATLFTTQQRIEIEKSIDLEKILNTEKEIEIIFFGYAGCVDICTPRLTYLDEMYKKIPSRLQSKLNVVFVDISSPTNPSLPDQFAKNFNENFIGVYLKPDDIKEYTKAFSVYFSKSLFDETEYNHSTNLYVVSKKNNKKSIRYVYNTYPYKIDTIIEDIQSLISE